MKWFRKSAEQGDVSAQFGLGWMYANFLQDDIYTHMWWNIAASNGNADAVKSRDIVEKRMTTEQLAEAQKLARECVKKNYKGC